MSMDLNKLNKEFRYQEIIDLAIKSLSNSMIKHNNNHRSDTILAETASAADGSIIGNQITISPYD